MKNSREVLDLEMVAHRYREVGRADKSKILSEIVDLHGYSRKYLIQVFNCLARIKHERRGPKARYEQELLLKPLVNIWLAAGQMCSKKLKAALPLWLPFYDKTFTPLPTVVKKQLKKMSARTIDRLLKSSKVKYKRHGLSGTRPGYLLKSQIPIKTDHWDVSSPGFMEADTVAHCGNSIDGSFVWSITLTDICTGWTEIRATWNKGAVGVIEQIKDIETMLPFPILGFDCDNGSEFLNWHLLRYFTDKRSQPVQVTRSRPYRKNDNAHVEQKNWTHVRHLFFYDRFDNPKLVGLMNDLYRNEWSLYQNYFIKIITRVFKFYKNFEENFKNDILSFVFKKVIISFIKMLKKEVKIKNSSNPHEI